MKTFIIAVLISTVSFTSFAQGPGHQRRHIPHHPRVNQVNKRIDHQEHRINQERKEGEITKGQARQDRRNLSKVNREKHDMRSMDKGHLTKTDQKALNQQLNNNSRKIGK